MSATSNSKIDLYVKPLSDEAAFTKGVEYFSELFFFYGVLFTIALWEVEKSHQASVALKADLASLRKSCEGTGNCNNRIESDVLNLK